MPKRTYQASKRTRKRLMPVGVEIHYKRHVQQHS